MKCEQTKKYQGMNKLERNTLKELGEICSLSNPLAYIVVLLLCKYVCFLLYLKFQHTAFLSLAFPRA